MIKELEELNGIISDEEKIIRELDSFSSMIGESKKEDEKKIISLQTSELKESLKKSCAKAIGLLEKITLTKPLTEGKKISKKHKEPTDSHKSASKKPDREFKMTALEKSTIKRLKRKEEATKEKKIKEPNKYVGFANKLFFKYSTNLANTSMFKHAQKDLIKANLQFILPSYISVILLTTLLSLFLSFFILLFFLFFNLGANLPIITFSQENLFSRFLKVFWVLFAIPAATFIMMYTYPSLEKKSVENKINQELPFATIHMSSISNAMVEPSKIFTILIAAKEYPHLERELTKIMNEVNIYGYNLVSALRNMAFNSPSRKLSDLFNGIATTVTSGGDLSAFFEKRSQGLLFEHQLEREKQTKSAETFMDLYISIVIAAPMILMLLLIMLKLSGLGPNITTAMITLSMVLGVSAINIAFLTFLHLKQPSK